MAIRFSPRLAILLLLLHSTAAVVFHMTAMPLVVRLLMLLAILLSLIFYLARDVFLLMPESWREITLDQDAIAVVTHDGSKLFGRIENETVASSFLIVLRVKIDGRSLPVFRVIFPDSFGPDALGADKFREFCVRLKFA